MDIALREEATPISGFFFFCSNIHYSCITLVVKNPSHVSFAKYSSKKGYSPIVIRPKMLATGFIVILCGGKHKLLTYTFGEDYVLTLHKNSSSKSVILQDLKSPHKCRALQ